MVHRLRGSLPEIMLVVIILSAGCSGLPATDQREPAPESTVGDFSYPPGWSQGGIADLAVVLQTHDATVNNTSRRSRLVTIGEDSNRTVVRTIDTDAGTASVRWIDTEFGGDIHSYYSAEGVFEYDRTTGELNRNPGESWTQSRVASHERLQRPLTGIEVTATETVTVEGTTAVRYNVTGIANPTQVPADNATGHVVVAEEGYVAAYNITRGNDGFSRQTIYDVSEFGNATVTRPAWMPDE